MKFLNFFSILLSLKHVFLKTAKPSIKKKKQQLIFVFGKLDLTGEILETIISRLLMSLSPSYSSVLQALSFITLVDSSSAWSKDIFGSMK